ncbi:AgmX/PglI C-terminal domain-containing protein [Nannocystis sp.]|uniref:AgmX/PglI C-terminal domain-containing protein n=1 Tax=Nannocystis sp. TaxID=1962667 RepID=UPI002421A973|nr:AgmX/PglI C-terminal domain-containing protein [Nannocystis sp.]MBK7824425.1 AgmX/PglI C-terminal domain-containing protein [Nannocystis sp.]MBK9753325.1 AgmX/PglI C-terminal domain-containing protein [Nannocystis sp.]
MTTPRASSNSWTLLAVAVSALTMTACKKSADTKAPDGGGGGDEVSHAGDNGGDASPGDDAAPEFLTVDVFEEVLDKHKGDVSDCYATAKEAKADLAGKLVLDFTVDGTGKVSEVKVDPASTLKDDGVNACVSDKAKGWSFPKTRDGQSMTLPYSFNLS